MFTFRYYTLFTPAQNHTCCTCGARLTKHTYMDLSAIGHAPTQLLPHQHPRVYQS